MPTEEPKSAPVELSDLADAFEFVNGSNLGENRAYIHRTTGQIIFVSKSVELEVNTEFSNVPKPADYLPVPHRQDLDLANACSCRSLRKNSRARSTRREEYFAEKGAYSQFKQLLQASGTIDKWHVFEARATRTALEDWCAGVGLR